MIALLKEKDVNKQLPFIIKPLPDNFRRVHLYLEFLDNPIKIEKPDIISLKRAGFTVVELGVYVKD